jgi:ABC-type lipoprotein export system ATPase subunit
MRLLQIKLDGFGQFNHGLSIKLEPSKLNLIVGRNEAGKSTLLNATSGILFGFRDLNVARRYEPWGDHDTYSGELEFQADDGRRIRVARDFRAGRATILEVGSGEHHVMFDGSADPRGSTPDDRRYFELLGELLGMQDESVFCSTVFVGQMSLKTAVSDQIRRLLSGSESVDYKGALHELHGRFSELTNENPWRSRGVGRKRALDQTRDDLAATEKNFDDGKARLLRFVEAESEMLDLERRKASHQANLKALEANQDAAERFTTMLERREAATRRADEARRRHESYATHQQKQNVAEDRIRRDYAQFRNAPDSFQDDANAWISEGAERGREVEALATERERLAALKPTRNRWLGIALGLLLLGASTAAGAWSSFGVTPGAIVGVVLGCAGFLAGSNLGTGFRARKEELERRIVEIEASIRGRDKRLDDLAAATSNLLLGTNPDEVLAAYREFVALREERRRLLSAMRAIGDGDAVSRALAEAVSEQGRIEAAIEDSASRTPWLGALATPGKVGVEVTRLKNEIAAATATRDAERARVEALRVELAGLSARLDFDLAALAESAREQRVRVRDYALEKDALKEAIDTLDACIKEFQENDVFRLEEEMSQLFARITDQKYTRVHLGPTLDPMVATSDRVGIRPEDLSAGAHDQLYFAMRIAMVRHLSRNVRLPIFLDDPFVNFDAERLQVTRDVLKALPDHQIVMVTCDRNYEDWTDAVVDLDKARKSP